MKKKAEDSMQADGAVTDDAAVDEQVESGDQVDETDEFGQGQIGEGELVDDMDGFDQRQDAATDKNQDVGDGLIAENAELKELLQRTRADFENFRKQTEKQRLQAMDAARYATMMKVLALVDDLDRAMLTYPKELAPLEKNFKKTLKDLGLEKINSDNGVEFNPDYHEAVSMEEGDGEKEIVIETLRPGYFYEGAVIRPAMVKVGK